MDEHITPEAGHSTALTSNAQINKFLAKIDEKFKQLKANDMTRGDQHVLKNHRLSLVWGEPIEKADGEDASATLWRKARARRVYAEIQDADDHLFFTFVLAIPPTECAKTGFENVLDYLIRLENYKPYHLNLSPVTKRFLESTAAEQGFTGNRRYLSFMQALFPQSTKSPSFTCESY